MAETELEQLLRFEFEGLAVSGNAKRLMSIHPDGLLQHLQRTGNRSKIEEAWLIPDICQEPTGIWQGLNRAGQDEVYCYSGVPRGTFATQRGKTIDIPPERVFLVFLTADFKAIKWRYCQGDLNRPGFSVGPDTRFGERLWPRD